MHEICAKTRMKCEELVGKGNKQRYSALETCFSKDLKASNTRPRPSSSLLKYELSLVHRRREVVVWKKNLVNKSYKKKKHNSTTLGVVFRTEVVEIISTFECL